LYYALWQLAPEDDATRLAAAAFARAAYVETGEVIYRLRYQTLVGEPLPDPPSLPDVSALIPDQPEGLDLAALLAELEASFDRMP